MRSSSARPTALVPNATPATTSEQRSLSASSHRPPLTVVTGPGAQQTQNEHHSRHIPLSAVHESAGARPFDAQSGQTRGGELLSPVTFGNHVGSSKTTHFSNLTSLPHNAQSLAVAYHHIQGLAAKRISTLGYLRQAHEGRVYWFNTIRFTRADLAKLPSFEARKLARRASAHLLLGLSIPTILDPNSSTAMDYLRMFNALLTEFEAYTNVHPSDGSTSSTFSRSKLPQMWKRATHSTVVRGRRVSSADALSPPSNESLDGRASNIGSPFTSSTTSLTTLPTNDQDLHRGEEYSFLLTPSLPFDPDYFETFATLCDVLIDCYTRVMKLITSPAACTHGVADMFNKADEKVRKLLMTGLIRDFEEASKQSIRAEIAGIGKLVLGGLAT